jgi:hypothetical protein
VLHHAQAYFFCLMLCFIARPPRLVSDFDSLLVSDQWSCALWVSYPAHDPAEPSPARRAPHATLSLPFLSFVFPMQQLLLPLFHLSLSPYALGDPVTVISGFWTPKVSSPFPSLSLPLPPLSPLPCTRPRPSLLRVRAWRGPGGPLAWPWWPLGAAPVAPWHGPGGFLAQSRAWPRWLALARPRRLALARPTWPSARAARSRARNPSVRDV